MYANDYIRKALTVSVLLVFVLTSCTSYKALNPQPQALHDELRIQDSVNIITTDKRHMQFRITAIRADTIFASHQHILFNEIEKIEKRKVSVAKTTGVVLLTSLGLVALSSVIISDGVRSSLKGE